MLLYSRCKSCTLVGAHCAECATIMATIAEVIGLTEIVAADASSTVAGMCVASCQEASL